jgi:diaminopimelate decarboxylase
MLGLFPESAAVDTGELHLGGVSASRLADEFGTPLVVYCERTLRGATTAYKRSAPEALIAYSVKAFPNVEVLRLAGAEGLGADVSTLGELAFARRAGVPGERLVVHGNNKSDDELRAAVEANAALVVLDAPDEVDRAAAAGVRTVLVRVTPGIDADTHASVATARHGSKFGLGSDQALDAIGRARAARLDVAGLHVQLGSQLRDLAPVRTAIDWLAGFAVGCRAALEWTPEVVNLGGGLGIQYADDEPVPTIEEFVGGLRERLEQAWRLHGLPSPRLMLEPGRSLVGRAGVTLYRVGVVKRASETTTYVNVDGGMSDNPRPQLYGGRYAAVLANRAREEPAGRYAVAGKHCEAGDVLIERAALPEPRRGDVLAVPVTGAYTLSMSSNYNSVPRPAAVLVADGSARLIRRRETVDDLLAFER